MSVISELIDRDKIEDVADEALKSANQSNLRRQIAFRREVMTRDRSVTSIEG